MVLKQQHFDLADGTVPTTSNTGTTGNDALNSVTITGLTMATSTAQKMHGTGSLKITPPGTAVASTGKLSYYFTTTNAVTTVTGSFYIYLTGLPSAVTNLFNVYTASGYSTVNAVNLNSTGALNYNVSGGVSQTLAGFTFSLNTWYRIESTVVIDATSGSVNTRVYAGDSSTVVAQLNPTGINTLNGDGTPQVVSSVTLGKVGGSASMALFYVDDFRVQDSDALMGPYVPGAPIVSASSSVSSTAVQLNALATTYDNAVTYAWTQVSGPSTLTLSSTTTANPTSTFGSAAAGDYVFRVTITDDLSRTATATTTFTYTGNVAGPTVTGTGFTSPRWVEQVNATAAAGGALSYSISPSTNITHHGNGLYSGPIPAASTQYAVTVTEASNPTTTTFRFTIAGTPTATGGLRILQASDDQANGGTFS